MTRRKIEIYTLAGLVLLAAGMYLYNKNTGSVVPGVFAANEKFTPLDIQEPQLRLDLLANLQKLEYQGSHRDIFSSAPPPPPPAQAAEAQQFQNKGPQLPPPPPPVHVPAEFFGTATMTQSGTKVAFFKLNNDEDVLVVEEGSVFMNQYRLLHIGNDSAEVEEISSKRKTSVPLVQPANNSPDQPPNQ